MRLMTVTAAMSTVLLCSCYNPDVRTYSLYWECLSGFCGNATTTLSRLDRLSIILPPPGYESDLTFTSSNDPTIGETAVAPDPGDDGNCRGIEGFEVGETEVPTWQLCLLSDGCRGQLTYIEEGTGAFADWLVVGTEINN